MKDFRQRLVQRPPERSEVTSLLRQGALAKALRKARAAGFVILQEEIDATAKAMFGAGRAGELLAMIGTVDVKLPYDTTTLLIRAFEAGDHHTFLKQAHRLRTTAGLESRIQEAITAIEQRAPNEASAWRRKFGAT
jgi:hypothetical protein